MINTQQILVMSDTHGSTASISDILAHHPNITNIFHCGDSELNHHDPLLENIHIVRGNCDGDHNFPSELIISSHNHIIYLTHGHLYGVKSSLNKLAERAEQHNATLALYGHTHIARADTVNDILCVNPGSIAYPRGDIGASYCIITFNHVKITIDFYDLQHTLRLTKNHGL